jgi:suppressor of ftsI/bilirubin oxidase
MATRRRDFIKALGGLGLSVLPLRALSDGAAGGVSTPNFCGAGSGGRPLFIPGTQGLFGRIALDGPARMRAAPPVTGDRGPWSLGFQVEQGGRSYVNPTLVLRTGQRVRIDFENALTEPSIVHWHGLAVDTRNDGAGLTLAAPGERYSYDFEVRNRAGLYWYHPHPHGMTAGQAYRGLFGLIEIEDDDERRLRTALDLVPGKSEIPLILQDRSDGDYAPGDADRMHGFLGDDVLINGTACPHLDVATRIYRFRVLNASNARTYRLGLRSASGKEVPFTLIGTDGGLLESPLRCSEAFLSTAERIDMLVDFSDAAVGDTVILETRAFDPMHMEKGEAPAAVDHAAMSHGAGSDGSASSPGSATHDHASMGHAIAFPEGAQRALLQLRVREHITYAGRIPERLASVAPVAVADASERPLRLGFAKGRWRINDRVFAMGETPIEVRRDAVETWLIRNYFNSMPHAMHLHGFQFRVIERQTSPDQLVPLKVDAKGRLATDLGWKDTVLVWPGESVRIAIDFKMPFADAQTYVFHCHNLEHEDGGMMLGVKVA